jgi:anti-sigma B factor antagonist
VITTARLHWMMAALGWAGRVLGGLAGVLCKSGAKAGMSGGPAGSMAWAAGPGPVPGVMVVTAWAAGLGAPLAACDRRLVMDGELAITVRRERGVVIVAVNGDIDISTVTRLRERLSGLADRGQPLIVDLNRVTFIDSAGLGALVGAARRAAAHGGSLHAVCARPQTRKLLWLTGVDRRIPLAATVDGALMFLAASRDAPG